MAGESAFAASLPEHLAKLEEILVRGLVWTGSPGHVPQLSVPIIPMETVGGIKELDAVIDLSERPDISKELRRSLPDVDVAGKWLADLLTGISKERIYLRKQTLEARQTEEKLNAVFNAAQEAIQVVDKNGNLTYINKAYTQVTGIPREKRIGKNVMDVASDGALAEVLRTRKPVFGHTMVTETGVDVMCNASPILLDGEMTGAVVVFRDVSNMKKLAKIMDMNKAELDSLKSSITNLASASHTFDDFIGQSPEILKCVSLAKKVAQNSTTVLITGQSGTGKEILAQAIHNYGSRAEKPFISVNCAAIPEGLLESELFGHEKGAFTGATAAKAGKFELADKGTIFLDEIGDLEFALQAKVLRVLQEKEIVRVGGSKTKRIDVKVIAATNRNLLDAVREGKFRQDLYYRLNVIPLHLVPLRNRGWDIILLAEDILRRKNKRYNKSCVLESGAAQRLLAYSWPGNVREMENVLERAVLLTEGNSISAAMISHFLDAGKSVEPPPTLTTLAESEKALLEQALKVYGTDVSGKRKAAEALEISLSTLYNKMDKYGISKNYKRNSKNENISHREK